MKVVYIILGIVILLVVGVIYILNIFKHKKNDIDEAFATMDVYLKKRWDLIPNLVEVSKSYAKYEKDTLVDIVKERNNYDTMSNNEKINVNNRLTQYLALVESYPELKANQNYLELQKSLTKIENEIADSRKYYNAVVKLYNNLVESFPTNLVAKLFNYKTMAMFEINSVEKNNVEVSLDEKEE